MKKMLFLIFCLISTKSYCKTAIGSSSEKIAFFNNANYFEPSKPEILYPAKNAIAIFAYNGKLLAGFGFENGDVKLCTTGLSLASPIDSNVHFVRFLKLGPVLIDEPQLAVGISKIPPIDRKSEPEIGVYNPEVSVLTDTSTYQKMKEYIYYNEKLLQKDTIGLNYNMIGNFKIIIDNKNSYYLKSSESHVFFKGLYSFLQQKKADERVIDQMLKYLYD